MLKTTRSSNKPAFGKNNGSRSASCRNNDKKPAFKKNKGSNEFDVFGGDGIDYTKKSRKLKGQTLSKS